MKRCKICGVLKPLSEFYRAAGAADGHRSDCKPCNLARKKMWYSQNREAVIEKTKRWQSDNRVRYNAYQREYRGTRTQEIREGHLRRTFGISQADCDSLLARQCGGGGLSGEETGARSLHPPPHPETRGG